MKTAVENIVSKRWPELKSRVHLPLFAVVTGIPDPPSGGQTCSAERPYYAVDVRLLTENGEIDEEMPLICDVPVAMTGSTHSRGFASLPQPGTIVELAFAFGRQDKPFIRSVLPYGMALPVCDGKSQRWEQTATSWLEIDAVGNWNHKTDQNVTSEIDQDLTVIVHQNVTGQVDQDVTLEVGKNIEITAGQNITRSANLKIADSALVEYSATAPKIWIGSMGDNFLQIVADFMQTTAAALTTLAGHIHEYPDGVTKEPKQKSSIAGSAAEVEAEKARTEVIKK
ncbi:hypothetical protein HF882_09150 [Victivallis vadensis]|uniref:Gp5/Type VI secretion system Vgr protein OB-fold domain-containing protein n=1 Tax=Victivallis vadensis TaxID=172901 RepID=A0A848AZS4_9BACT|nr:hypothetical protein [Victivallis vadensis]NMD86749.1 hypothetical protein [Victivallis vadensis]